MIENDLDKAYEIINNLSLAFPCGFVAGGFALDTWKKTIPKDIDFYIPTLRFNKTEDTRNICEIINESFPSFSVQWEKINRKGDYSNERIDSIKDLTINGWKVQIIQWNIILKDFNGDLFFNDVLSHFAVSTTCIGYYHGIYLTHERFLNSILNKEISVNPKFFGRSNFSANLEHIQKQQSKFPQFKLIWE
ncbi:MAG TPA: hypothetical protein PLJ37_00830 [Chitinophagales bacterium]|nr:hypothetical protein [Chitinophagales bacterium]HMW93496.1 hypothetical protein [Chitinophagales bacterium]HMZ92881.1 hypothetical protein [Chitinophagales bacterium]HNG25930.1 hypothetical protein [Chitinophagales bacterium]